VKRLTILPTEEASAGEIPVKRTASGAGRQAEKAVEPLERRKQPRIERRDDQRRRAIALRIVPDRRMALGVPVHDALFADSRSGAERRASSARRRLGERRAGVRMIDLTDLDLSALGL